MTPAQLGQEVAIASDFPRNPLAPPITPKLLDDARNMVSEPCPNAERVVHSHLEILSKLKDGSAFTMEGLQNLAKGGFLKPGQLVLILEEVHDGDLGGDLDGPLTLVRPKKAVIFDAAAATYLEAMIKDLRTLDPKEAYTLLRDEIEQPDPLCSMEILASIQIGEVAPPSLSIDYDEILVDRSKGVVLGEPSTAEYQDLALKNHCLDISVVNVDLRGSFLHYKGLPDL